MKKILILALNNLESDPRVDRQIDFLADKYEVIAAGFSPPNNKNVQFVSLIEPDEINQCYELPLSTVKISASNSRNLTRRYIGYYSLIIFVFRLILARKLLNPSILRQLFVLFKNLIRLSVSSNKKAKEFSTWIFLWFITKAKKARKIIKTPDFSFETAYWKNKLYINAFNKIKNIYPDIIVANDSITLPMAAKFLPNTKIVLDAHEYSPREFEDLLFWNLFHRPLITNICNKYIPKVNNMVTVCPGISSAYRQLTGKNAFVIDNAPKYFDLKPRFLKKTHRIQLVHHGAAIPSRKIENMIYMMDTIDDRFELNLILVGGNKKYIHFLQNISKKRKNIKFLEPVPMNTLPVFLNAFDVGIFLLKPTNFNYYFALPNKLFEFIQARIAIAIGPSPEMADIVQRYNCGIVSSSFLISSFAKSLNALDTDKINYFKFKSHQAAKVHNANHNSTKFNRIIEELYENKAA